jgi:arylsulfatase A-like enzyme
MHVKNLSLKFFSLMALLATGFLLLGCEPSTPEAAPEIKPFKRIIFVTIDTLRADHLKAYGYLRQTAPFIDSLLSRGTYFTQAFTAASHTAPSHTSMFTSRFPYQHRVLRNHDQLDEKFYTLPKALQSNGFITAALPAVSFLEGKVGFPQLPAEEDLKGSGIHKTLRYRNAEVNTNRALHFLKGKQDKKLFLWLHYFDVHEWDNLKGLPKEYHHLHDQDDPEELINFITKEHRISVNFHKTREKFFAAINRYDARLRFVDDQLKKLHSFMQEQNMLDDTLWVITSDHGEGLGAHNYKEHGEYLYQEQLHIPLIFYSSREDLRRGAISELVRTVDLLPTLLNLSGLSAPCDQKLEGLSLRPLLQTGNWANKRVMYSFAERRPKDDTPLRRNWEPGEVFSVHDQSEKYIHHTEGTNEFYNLKSDPHEEVNLGKKLTELKTIFLKKVQQMLQFHQSGEKLQDQKLSPDQYQELKTLGYM